MSAPVDVLAVMDAACCVLSIDKMSDPQRRLELARAAVSELIAADMEVDAAAEARWNAPLGRGFDAAHKRYIKATERRRAALARCGGAK